VTGMNGTEVMRSSQRRGMGLVLRPFIADTAPDVIALLTLIRFSKPTTEGRLFSFLSSLSLSSHSSPPTSLAQWHDKRGSGREA
jgi:hypothetical protein